MNYLSVIDIDLFEISGLSDRPTYLILYAKLCICLISYGHKGDR